MDNPRVVLKPVVVERTAISLILRGVLAIAAGIIALAWPGVTVLALVIVFAVYTFIGAGLQAMLAFRSAGAGQVFGHLLLGMVDLAAGVIAVVWPGVTVLALVLIVSIWALTGGLVQIFAAFRSGETAGMRALLVVGGLVSAAFGVVLFSRPGFGALTLALLFGFFNLSYGFSRIAMGVQVRRAAHVPAQVVRTTTDTLASPLDHRHSS